MKISLFTVSLLPFRHPNLLIKAIAGIVIWSGLIPLGILHLWTWMFQEIYFSLLDIPKVPLRDHLTFDRGSLKKLSLGQKLSCAYCDYANGTISWMKAVINRTEVYSCAIRHRTTILGQEHQKDYLPYEQFQ